MKKLYELEGNKIIINDKELFSHLPLLGFGGQGDVYKIRINNKIYALKVFNNCNLESINKYENKLNLNIESFVSPKKFLYINDRLSGYLMDFYKGNDLSKKKLDLSIDEFAKDSVRLIDDTKKLSNEGYSIYNTGMSDVMHDNGFKILDIDDYKKEGTNHHASLINQLKMNKLLISIFVKNTDLAKLFFEKEELYKLMDDCNSGNITFEEFFNDMCIRAYNESEDDIKSISEIGKVLKNRKFK